MPQKNKNTSQNQTLLQKCDQRNKYVESPSCLILWTIFDRKTKLMTMHELLRSSDDIYRLKVSSKEAERELMENCVDASWTPDKYQKKKKKQRTINYNCQK